MDSKMLSIRSFERNQTLIAMINKVITHLRLKVHGISDDLDSTEISNAKNVLIRFLESINKAFKEDPHGAKILKGADMRERSFIRKYFDARKKPKQYKSLLFKKSPKEVVNLLTIGSANNDQLIESLIDLRSLINEHLAIDLKDLVGDI
ncbi:MAG TPA: hypothetical protein VHN59_06865 [Chitinophagaceae bacterium]|nr:hypothetical protein [Chitinophagaceae bacterium]